MPVSWVRVWLALVVDTLALLCPVLVGLSAADAVEPFGLDPLVVGYGGAAVGFSALLLLELLLLHHRWSVGSLVLGLRSTDGRALPDRATALLVAPVVMPVVWLVRRRPHSVVHAVAELRTPLARGLRLLGLLAVLAGPAAVVWAVRT